MESSISMNGLKGEMFVGKDFSTKLNDENNVIGKTNKVVQLESSGGAR